MIREKAKRTPFQTKQRVAKNLNRKSHRRVKLPKGLAKNQQVSSIPYFNYKLQRTRENAQIYPGIDRD
jgi:hypothetical protein